MMRLRVNFIAAIALLGILICGGCSGKAPASPQDTTASSNVVDATAQEDWTVYEDDFIRIRHPKGRPVFGPREAAKKAARRSYIVMGPNDAPTYPSAEAIIISEKDPILGSLRELAQDHVKNGAKEQMRLLGGFRDVTPNGGRCISLVLEGHTSSSCKTADGEERADCFMVNLTAECQTNKGMHLSIYSGGGGYPISGQLNANAQGQIEVFDRFLKDIEFRK